MVDTWADTSSPESEALRAVIAAENPAPPTCEEAETENAGSGKKPAPAIAAGQTHEIYCKNNQYQHMTKITPTVLAQA